MALSLTITQLIADELPAGFTVSEDYIANRLKVWQLLLYEAAGLEVGEAYDITKYTDEWLVLFSYLIIYDILTRILMGNFVSVLGTGSTETEEEGGGGIKKIVTGPTEVEFHDTGKALAEILKALRAGGGIFDQFLGTACGFANKLGIKLPFCAIVNSPGCISILKNKFPHAGFNGLTTYAQDKPKSVG